MKTKLVIFWIGLVLTACLLYMGNRWVEATSRKINLERDRLPTAWVPSDIRIIPHGSTNQIVIDIGLRADGMMTWRMQR